MASARGAARGISFRGRSSRASWPLLARLGTHSAVHGSRAFPDAPVLDPPLRPPGLDRLRDLVGDQLFATTSRAVYSPPVPATGATVSVPRQVLPSRSWNDHDREFASPFPADVEVQRACFSSACPKLPSSAETLCVE